MTRIALVAAVLMVVLVVPGTAAAQVPGEQAPIIRFGTFEHQVRGDLHDFAIPVTCSEPAAVRIDFDVTIEGEHWVATGQAGPDSATMIAAAPPPKVADYLIGKTSMPVQVHGHCIDAAGRESAVEWLTAIRITGPKRGPTAHCTTQWKRSYRRADLLGRGLRVAVRCDGPTRAGAWLAIADEEKLGIPPKLWRRNGGMRMVRFSAAGTQVVRLKAARWSRRYWRRAKEPVGVLLALAVDTNQRDIVQIGRRTRVTIR